MTHPAPTLTPAYAAVPAPAAPTSRLAVAALALSPVPFLALLTDVAVFLFLPASTRAAPSQSIEMAAVLVLTGVALTTGVTAVVLGAVALRAVHRDGLRGRGLAVGAVVTGAAGLLTTVGVILLITALAVLAFG